MVGKPQAPEAFKAGSKGGLMNWVNTRPLACMNPFARSANAREARFIGEYIVTDEIF